MCATYNNKGKKYCNSKMIPEEKLIETAEGIDLSQVDHIKVESNNTLIYIFKDSTEITRQGKGHAPAECWLL